MKNVFKVNKKKDIQAGLMLDFSELKSNELVKDKVSTKPPTEKKKLSFVTTGKELLEKEVVKEPFLLGNIIPKTGVIAIAGSSDTGKSTFLRELAIAIVKGDDTFLGFKLNQKHKNVIYVSTEDDENSVQTILSEKFTKEESDQLSGLQFIFESNNLEKKLSTALNEQSVDCIIIDTFADIYPGELNAANKVRNFIEVFYNITKRHNCLLVFLHHTGKGKEEQLPSKNNLVGSQGFESKMRLVIELRKDWKDSSIRHLCIVKGNYLSSDYKDRSYVLEYKDRAFVNTGRRTPFSELAKPDQVSSQEDHVRERAINLKKQGLTINQIKEKLDQEGLVFSNGKIGNWVKGVKSELKTDETSSEGDAEIEIPSIQDTIEVIMDGQEPEESTNPSIQLPKDETLDGQNLNQSDEEEDAVVAA